MTCEGSDEAEDGLEEKEEFAGGKRKSTHGGCGYKQPLIRKDGLKLYAQFRGNAGDVSISIATYLKSISTYQLLLGQWRRRKTTIDSCQSIANP